MSVPSSVRSRRKKQQNREETGRVRADREETQRRSEEQEEQEEQEEEEECGAEFQEKLQRRLCSPAGSMRWQPRRVLIRLQERSREEEREDREKQEIRATPEKFCTNHSVHQRAVYTHRSHSAPGAGGPL